MITKLTLRNFKCLREQTYEFTNFDLLVGRNNSGKSTVLQALAIWQFCMDEFHRADRGGTTGTRVLLPDFTALPLPEFNLLWHERTDRKNVPITKDGKRKYSPELLYIEIDVEWVPAAGQRQQYLMRLRYESPQAVYALPDEGGWKRFRALDKDGLLPRIAYVPPFSGLEPVEEWRDIGPIRKQVGKAQPGSVLRNLLLRVLGPQQTNGMETLPGNEAKASDWEELTRVVQRWFSAELQKPIYRPGATKIECEYKHGRKAYDLIAGGSGFHQALTLLAFLYGYKPTTLLLDEPDAHLHVNLQREILDYFKDQAAKRDVQFLIATHAEELVQGVDVSQILSLVSGKPERVESTPRVLAAMADVSNPEISWLRDSPFIFYLEGAADERILRAWARILGHEQIFRRFCIHVMGGGNKKEMLADAERHFSGVRAIVKEAQRVLLFDYDSEESYHPEAGNPTLHEWKRKNIENYLLVPSAWIQAATGGQLLQPSANGSESPRTAVIETITKFFRSENLTLPDGQDWRTTQANIFKLLDGKKLLFDSENSMFHRLRKCPTPVVLPREKVAAAMKPEEIHQDVHEFFAKLQKVIA